MFESGHLTLVSGAGEGEVVSKKVGKEVRGAQGGVDRRSYNATSVDVDDDRAVYCSLSESNHRIPLGRVRTP